MKKIVAVLFWLGTVSVALAQEEKWTELFNGKDLTGWKQLGGYARYFVDNGELVGMIVNNTPHSYLCTEKEYDDFILEFDIKLDDPMWGGIQFRSQSNPAYQNGLVHGYQVEVDPTERAWSGGIYDEGRRGWLYTTEINPAAKKAFRLGEWNTYRIEAIGTTIRTWINGIPTAHVVDDMTATGFIGLQVHALYGTMTPGYQTRWRNIRIQTADLRSSPPDACPVVNLMVNYLSLQEQAQGFKMLFNGKDFRGWRTVDGTKIPDTHWRIGNGAITINSSDGSETRNDLVTTDKYGAFELVFEFKLTEGAASGVTYYVDDQDDSDGKSGIGLEYQIVDDERHPEGKASQGGNRSLASLYDLIPPLTLEKRWQRKIGDWNQARIIVYPNNLVQHWLNGFKVVEYKRGSQLFSDLVGRSIYQNDKNFGSVDKGNILLQDQGNEVSFRNMKIREIN